MILLDSGGGWERSAGRHGSDCRRTMSATVSSTLRLLYHLGAVLGDAPLLLPGHQDGGAAGHRVAQRQLADVVHQRRVLELEQRRLRHAELPADRHRQAAHPGRVPGLHVAADLGDPGQCPHRLQVGGPDPGVPAQRHLGDEQRRGEHGDRGEPHDLGGERDEQRRRAGRGGDRELNPQLVAERDAEPGPQRVGPDERAHHRLEQPGERRRAPSMTGSSDHHLPPISPALASGRNVGRDARHREQPGGHRGDPGRPADRQVRQRADDHRDRGHRDDLRRHRPGRGCCRSAAAARRPSRPRWRWGPPPGLPAGSAAAARRTRSARRTPSAACTSCTPLTAVCATDQMSSRPANAASSQCPESRACRGSPRGSYRRAGHRVTGSRWSAAALPRASSPAPSSRPARSP